MVNDIINPFMPYEFTPAIIEHVDLKKYNPLPLSELPALGLAIEPVVQFISSATGASGSAMAAGGSGLYWVNVPAGTHLAEFLNGKGYLGSALSNATNQVGAGQAVLTPAASAPIAFDPAMIMISCVIFTITQKLDSCIQVGKNILQYLELKDKSEITGSIKFMTDVFNNYKLNWNNQRFIDSNLAESVSIRRRSEESIELQKMLIENNLSDEGMVHGEKYIVEKYNSIVTHLKSYQLSLYMMSFSMFLEIIFNENYDPEYLRKAIDKINRYSIEYRTIYTDCYNFLKKIKVSSIGSKLKGGIAKLSGIAGSAVEVTPMISKSNLDENLKGVSERIERLKDLNTEYFMKEFTMLKDDYTKPISDSIREIAKLFNGDIKLLLDDTTLYFGIE
jgi:hypothetical protein